MTSERGSGKKKPVRVNRVTVSKPVSGKAHPRKPRTQGRISLVALVNSETVIITVDPRVWKAALQLAEGNARRIQIVSETEVIIHDSPEWPAWAYRAR